MKKISFMIALSLILSLSLSVCAFASNVSENEYYQEKGQIDLSEISEDLYVENNEVKVRGGRTASHDLLQELDISKNLEVCLAEEIQKGNTPVAIGYTRIYLKEVEDENGSYLEPVTINEFEEQEQMNVPAGSTQFALTASEGEKTNYKNKLTLYTSVFATATNKYCATSTAQWESTGVTSELRPTNKTDFISITAPSNLSYISSSFGSLCNGFYTNVPSGNYWLADQGYTSAVFGYVPLVSGQYSAWLASCSMHCSGTILNSKRTFKSQYVHNYGAVTPSITIGSPSGVTFSSVSNSWQIASTVNY